MDLHLIGFEVSKVWKAHVKYLVKKYVRLYYNPC